MARVSLIIEDVIGGPRDGSVDIRLVEDPPADECSRPTLAHRCGQWLLGVGRDAERQVLEHDYGIGD